jgi:hydrogenase maturation protein HypF
LADDRAQLSEHLGDLENPVAFRNFVAAIERLQTLLRVSPQHLVCDLHPEYHSARYAHSLGLPLTAVQHHHAHAAACIAENALDEPVIAICADGTGYGTDGAIWGGEVLRCDPDGRCERVGHLRYTPLFGGDGAARQCWRPAAGQLFESLGEGWPDLVTQLRPDADVTPQMLAVAANRLASGRGSVPTSSLGRLFDAVSFLLGIADENRFEGQAAIALESAAHRAEDTVAPLRWQLSRTEQCWQLDTRPLLRELCERIAAGEQKPRLARAFHQAIAAGFCAMAKEAAREAALKKVVLSGGCFFNRLLVAQVRAGLQKAGLSVYQHRLVPPGDGGLALGQALVATRRHHAS